MKVVELKALLSSLKIKPLKSLGQNFLLDEGVIHKIIKFYDIKTDSNIIEIGPGLGSLTWKLKALTQNLKLIELDKSLVGYWVKEGFEVVHQDALKFSWESVPEETILISNLPYQISSRLLVEIFLRGCNISKMVLMFQKEVGERIFAAPKDKKNYGLISIVNQLDWQITPVTSVSARSFYPPPEIQSVVLAFERKKQLQALNKKEFVLHLKRLFAGRRKKMKTTLKGEIFQVNSEILEKRPEELTPEEHVFLFSNKQ